MSVKLTSHLYLMPRLRMGGLSLYAPTCLHSMEMENYVCLYKYKYIQGVYKRMVRFQKLTRNLFLTLHGQNVHRQQRQLSKFLMRYQQFASHA